MTDSKKPVNNIEYVILNLDTNDKTDYRKISPIEKNIIIDDGNGGLLESKCRKCESTDLEYHKSIYTVKNMAAYAKKNVDLDKRYTQYYYLYSECKNCNEKQRIGGNIYPHTLPEIKFPPKKTLLQKINSWIKEYL